MALSTRLMMRQGQALVMTPQLLQAIKLLQLSSLELDAYLEGELERNPLLQREDGASMFRNEIATGKAWAAVAIGFTLNASAFLGDIWRGAIQALPRGQTEAAQALGLHAKKLDAGLAAAAVVIGEVVEELGDKLVRDQRGG